MLGAGIGKYRYYMCRQQYGCLCMCGNGYVYVFVHAHVSKTDDDNIHHNSKYSQ